MANWIEKAGKKISDYAEQLSNKIEDNLTEGYQSPLEINGRIMRRFSNVFNYYKADNPYVRAYSNSLLRANDSYVTASGWLPKTYDVKNLAIDLDYASMNKGNGKDSIFDTQN
jgi:hypothetical protein